MAKPKYARILLKLSGEALMGGQEYGIDPQILRQYSLEIKTIHELGVQIGIVATIRNCAPGFGNFSGVVECFRNLVIMHPNNGFEFVLCLQLSI